MDGALGSSSPSGTDRGEQPSTLSVRGSDYPALYALADSASLAGQRLHVGLLRAELLLLVAAAAVSITPSIAALLGFGPESDPWTRRTDVSVSVILVTALIVRVTSRIRRPDSDWFSGRAVAESVKTTAWQYMMRAGPFDVTDAEADITLVTKLREILASRKDLRPTGGVLLPDVPQITPRMRQIRSLSLPERRTCYLEARLLDQARWYARKADENRRNGTLWFWAGFAVQVVAVTFPLLRQANSALPNLAPVFTSVLAASTAWTQFRRHDDLNKSYALASQELTMLRSLMDRDEDAQAFAQRVVEVESTISREHKLWVATRG
jgi:SMODS and SLOG-associating 2TM effector domain 3/SMODS and SLOG-associating 2TM effector domain 1